MFGGMDTLVQALRSVIVENRHDLLADNGAGIDAGIDEMDGAAGDLDAIIQSLLPG